MPKAILKYTTTIEPAKTAGEIQAELVKRGAQAILLEYNNSGELVAMSFRLRKGQQDLHFKMPINVDGVLHHLHGKKIGGRYCTKQQAARVAWRILKHWVDGQLAFVDSGQADMVQVFFPYVQDSAGQTLYDRLIGEDFKLLSR
jgi:hypothetical protein